RGANAPAHRLCRSVRHEIIALLALGTLHRHVHLTDRRTRTLHHELEVMDHAFHLAGSHALGRKDYPRVIHVHRPVRQPGECLLQDPDALANLLEPHEVAIVDVALRAHRHFEVVRLVFQVREVLAYVVVHAACAQHGSGQAATDRLGSGECAHSRGTTHPDGILREHAIRFVDRTRERLHEVCNLLHPAFRNVGRHAAHSACGRRETRTDPALQQVVYVLALLEAPQERRERTDVNAGGAEPHEMRDDARELHGYHAKHLAPLCHSHPEQTLGAEREGNVVADRVQVVFAVGPGDDLVVLPVFADLLEPAVQVADVRHAAHHHLALQLEQEPQYAVGCRVLRTHIDEHGLTFQLVLEHRRGLVVHGTAGFIHHERNSLRPALRIEAGGAQL